MCMCVLYVNTDIHEKETRDEMPPEFSCVCVHLLQLLPALLKLTSSAASHVSASFPVSRPFFFWPLYVSFSFVFASHPNAQLQLLLHAIAGFQFSL